MLLPYLALFVLGLVEGEVTCDILLAHLSLSSPGGGLVSGAVVAGQGEFMPAPADGALPTSGRLDWSFWSPGLGGRRGGGGGGGKGEVLPAFL